MSLQSLKDRLSAASPQGWERLAGHRGQATLSQHDWDLVAHARDDLELAVRAFEAFIQHVAAICEFADAQSDETAGLNGAVRIRAAQRGLDDSDRILLAVLRDLEAAP